jgi:hypothetical protein
MPVNSFPYRAFKELPNGLKGKLKLRRRWREDIRDTLKQHGLTINDAISQARARILKMPLHRKGTGQQPQPSLVKESTNCCLKTLLLAHLDSFKMCK